MRRSSLLLAAFVFTLSSCGGAPNPDAPEIEEAERRLGAEQHPQLLAQFGGAYDGPEAAYVAEIGEKMAAVAGLAGQCRFTLVNTDVVNAFAVPGCYIYVTRGLMGLVNSEDELASVLAHEVGHIVGDHSERQQRRSVWRGLGVAAVGLITGSDRLSRLAGQAAELFGLRYSRAQEYESDDLGIRYLREAGYDPHAAADMLAALTRQEQFMAGVVDASGIPEWARTHPLTENRIERARETARDTGIAPDQIDEREAPYFEEVDGLLYGDDPEQGFVLGRRFVHPVMRIAFEAPPGFSLTNTPQAVLLNGPEGVRGEFGGGRYGRDGLEGYVSALLQQILGNAPARIGQAQAGRVAGVPTLIVPVEIQTQRGTALLNVAAYAGPGGAAYHFIMVSDGAPGTAAATGDLFGSFRFLSPAEATSLRPRVIRSVRIRPGDTLASLSAQMASDRPTDLFLTLNGRTRDEPLEPGDYVKIVTYAGA